MKTKFLSLAFILTIFLTAQAQKKCKCFSKEEYDAFVKSEQHQTVEEGENAQFTVILNKTTEEDVLITYKIYSETVNLNKDLILPDSNTLTIPKGQLFATVQIPVIQDQISEIGELFTIEIIEGVKANSKKKLNNKRLIRTRTIVDKGSSEDYIKITTQNKTVKTIPAAQEIDIKNLYGVTVENKNIAPGVYYVKANVNDQIVTRTIIVTQ